MGIKINIIFLTLFLTILSVYDVFGENLEVVHIEPIEVELNLNDVFC